MRSRPDETHANNIGPNGHFQHDREAENGFTLTEVLIVTALIGVLSGIAIPNLAASRLAANESTVIATMRAVATAQFQFVSQGELDSNRDADFEYGTLGELGAHDPMRGSGEVLMRNLLSEGVSRVNANGWVERQGYNYCLYLPAADGVGVVAVPANAASIDAAQSAAYWTMLAWPMEQSNTGNRTFFCNQQGQVLQAMLPGYSGSSTVPPAGAGLTGVSENEIDSQALATDRFGADGNHWTVVH
ncbi:MAG: DUF2950 family protein [Planctomycetota bacterium]